MWSQQPWSGEDVKRLGELVAAERATNKNGWVDWKRVAQGLGVSSDEL